MATTTITAPFSGGSFDLAIGRYDHTELSAGKFLLTWPQDNVPLWYSRVWTIENSTTQSTGPMRAWSDNPIDTPTITIGLTASKAVVLYNINLNGFKGRVLNLDTSDNIVESAESDLSVLPNTDVVSFGQYLVRLWKKDSNTFWFLYNTESTTTGVDVYEVTVDSNDNITASSLFAATNLDVLSRFSRIELRSLPGSTDVLFHGGNHFSRRTVSGSVVWANNPTVSQTNRNTTDYDRGLVVPLDSEKMVFLYGDIFEGGPKWWNRAGSYSLTNGNVIDGFFTYDENGTVEIGHHAAIAVDPQTIVDIGISEAANIQARVIQLNNDLRGGTTSSNTTNNGNGDRIWDDVADGNTGYLAEVGSQGDLAINHDFVYKVSRDVVVVIIGDTINNQFKAAILEAA